MAVKPNLQQKISTEWMASVDVVEVLNVHIYIAAAMSIHNWCKYLKKWSRDIRT
jgi:hypothetical protein